MLTTKSSTLSEKMIRDLADTGKHTELLYELLAVIHRDGGQYTILTGVAISTIDAIYAVEDTRRKYFALSERIRQLVDPVDRG